MAALELHCGVDPGVCVWSGVCVDSLDSFDSEMQQWEEQLQEVQRKIEELYKVVEARRGNSEMTLNSDAQLDITLLPLTTTRGFPNNGCYGEKASCMDVGVSDAGASQSYGVGDHEVLMDILDGYLGVDTRASLNRTAEKSHRVLNSSSAHNHAVPTNQNTSIQWPSSTRCALGEFEEVQNRKNKGCVWDETRVRHVSRREQVTKSHPKPPISQRDVPHAPPARPTHLPASPKCPLVDRRCGSPSVLRKFGAMLQENEGKTLLEDGIVTTLVPKPVPKSPRLGASRGPKPVPAEDARSPATHHSREQRGPKVAVKPSRRGTDSLQTGERIVGNGATPGKQVCCDSSPTAPRRSFSRPARPAHQRPPSRWAGHAPTAPPTAPRSRSLSPACEPKQRFHQYSLFTETIIM